MNDSVHTVTLFRNKKRVPYIFRDHWLRVYSVDQEGRTHYYLIAQNYGTGEQTGVWLKNKEEYDVLSQELKRGVDEAANFKDALHAYNILNICLNIRKAPF